jgi:isoamylase
MIALRRRHPALRRRSFLRGHAASLGPDVVWHGVEPGRPDFSPASRTLAFALDGRQTGREPDRDFYIACNAWEDVVVFRVPVSPSGRPWRRIVDTAAPPPRDIVEPDEGTPIPNQHVLRLQPHSLVVLISEE